MIAFILRRLLLMIPTTIGVALVIFSLYHIAPGDPALIAIGSQADATAGGGGDGDSRIDQFRREHGLDRAFFVQFFDYIGPFNLSPDGHPWFTSPRTERKIEDVEVEGRDTPVRQGLPAEIEPLYSTTDAERETLTTLVANVTSSDETTDPGRADAAMADLVAYAGQSADNRDEAVAAMMQGLFSLKLGGSTDEPGIVRLDATLEKVTGVDIQASLEYFDAALFEKDGVRHLLKSWFAWYYRDGGGYRVRNRGEQRFGGLLTGELGLEMQSKASVGDELKKRLKVTVPLSLVSVILSYLIALPLGIISVRRQGTRVDGALTVGLFVLYSIPMFWAGLMLILAFGKGGLTADGLLPILGLHDKDAASFGPIRYAWDVVLHSILPIATLTYGSLAYLSRQMRAGMLEVIRQDYIRTARAKGLSDDRVVYKHALRNSMIPVLTLLASILPILIGGSVIVELIFDIPGMGQYAYQGLLRRDFNIVMATTLFVGVMTQFGILFSDIAYSLVDPRIRLN
ncbi:Dipeptide transport system permease protein DppB [Planctomycetes bacterium Poly30]|uniref:Dipeptide transport system permease protein DppB n=1 Tax=Saltatorellus ferox TaxID=2528018 RepID=A0A518EVZ1_9BACT|nr:Dipeptide transport system permease protein DppB [Planctomycetes bacterium Poly30]